MCWFRAQGERVSEIQLKYFQFNRLTLGGYYCPLHNTEYHYFKLAFRCFYASKKHKKTNCGRVRIDPVHLRRFWRNPVAPQLAVIEPRPCTPPSLCEYRQPCGLLHNHVVGYKRRQRNCITVSLLKLRNPHLSNTFDLLMKTKVAWCGHV